MTSTTSKSFLLIMSILSLWPLFLSSMEPPRGNNVDIHDAATKGNTDLITKYIRAGGNVNLPDTAGNLPLKLAFTAKQNAAVKLLLLNGAYVETSSKEMEDVFSGSGSFITAILTEDNFGSAIPLIKFHLQEFFALEFAISQARVKSVAEFLAMKNFSLTELGEFLTLVHRLKSASTNPDHQARYKAIRDLLVIQGNRCVLTNTP